MKKLLKLMISCIILSLIAAMLLLSANAKIDSGYCGADNGYKNIKWTYDYDTQTLTLTGKGKMRDWRDNNETVFSNYKIKSIVLSNGITHIGHFAFWGSDITSIALPDSITSLGGYSFERCYYLRSITLPKNLTKIDFCAFSGCANLTTINIPAKVNTIGNGVFEHCGKLTSISVDDGNKYFTSVDGHLFSKDRTRIVTYCPGRTDTHYDIPQGVTDITGAFNSAKFYSVTIPSSITTIGDAAFYNCTNIRSFTIPNGVKRIGFCAFGDTNLNTITIPRSVTSIDAGAFSGCWNLSDIYYGGTKEDWNAIKVTYDDYYYMGEKEGISIYDATLHFAKQCTVTFNTNGGSAVNSLKIFEGNTIACPKAPTKSGYVFAGWYSNSGLTDIYNFAGTKITDDTVIYAKWIDKSNSIVMTMNSTNATVFGHDAKTDVPPIIYNDRAMLPARFIAENLGATVKWDGAKREVTIIGKHLKSGQSVEIVMHIEMKSAYVNGEHIRLDTVPFIRNNRTYTPVRFIAESLGATVEWNPHTSQSIITK